MPANDKIRRSDFNDVRARINEILGIGGGNQGYGQFVQSVDRTVSDRVTINEYNQLRYDITNAYKHIFGVSPDLSQPQEGNTVRFIPLGAQTSEFGTSEFGESEFNLVTLAGSESPYPQYDIFVDTIISNRFTVHPSQSSTLSLTPSSTTWPGPFGTSWNNRISATVTVGFPNSNAARHFFNSGGQIRFASSQSGGSGTAQILAWRSLLSDTGMRSFGGNNPGTGTSPANGQNWYRLSSTYSVWSTVSASTPYGSNSWRISARTGIEPSGSRVISNLSGAATIAEFLVEWIDNYVDPGQYPENPQPDTIDLVDGTFSLSVSYLYATGILEPPGVGNFTVTQPTIAVGQISGS
jgi:hypothetical protein